MTPYEEMANAIIQKQTLVLGETITSDIVSRVDGLTLKEDRSVSITAEDACDVIERLVAQFRGLLGAAAVLFARDAAALIIKENVGLQVPLSLRGAA